MRFIDSKFIYLFLTLLSKILINLVVVFYVAKQVSLAAFGEFILAFSYATILTMVFDYGFNLQSLILNPNDGRINATLNSMVGGKIVLICAMIPVIAAGFLIGEPSKDFMVIFSLLTLSSICTSFGNFFLNFFKTIDEYQKETFGYSVQVFFLILSLFILWLYQFNSVIMFAMAILFSRIIYVIWAFYFFKKSFNFIFKLELASVKTQLKEGISYAVHLILGTSIIYVDTFVLSYFESSESVGLYQAGMRLIMASMLMSTIINDAYLPKVRSLMNKSSKVVELLTELARYIIIGVLFIVLIFIIFQKQIILLLYTQEFLVLSQYFGYIIFIIVLRYVGIIPGLILTAYNFQKVRAVAVTVSLVIGIGFNVLLIPILGLLGAFVSSVISHILLNLIYVFNARKIVKNALSHEI